MRSKNHTKLLALLALVLFVPIPSISITLVSYLDNKQLASIIWIVAKIGLCVGPVLWFILIDKKRIPFTRTNIQGLKSATILGIFMLLAIWVSYDLFAAHSMNVPNFRNKLASVGLDNPVSYGLIALYWIVINSLLEEFIFRVFIFEQSQKLWATTTAVLMTAFFFTLHHSLALFLYVSVWQNVLASLGVFFASIIWSALYIKYKTIIPAYICHIFADIGVFSIGWYLLFL